jgi:hypothetical protein
MRGKMARLRLGPDRSIRDKAVAITSACAASHVVHVAGPALPKGSQRLPACQTILNAISNLLADGCQVEEFLFTEDIFGVFGKLPIHRRLVPKVIIPIHACHCAEGLS